MKTRWFYPVLLALFALESVFSQNAEELPIQVESDNQFPPERIEPDSDKESSITTVKPTKQASPTIVIPEEVAILPGQVPDKDNSTVAVESTSQLTGVPETTENKISKAIEITAAQLIQTTLTPTAPVNIPLVPANAADTPVPTIAADVPVLTIVADEPVPTIVADEPVPTIVADVPVPTIVADEPVPTITADAPISTIAADVLVPMLSLPTKEVTLTVTNTDEEATDKTTEVDIIQTTLRTTTANVIAPTLTTKYEENTINQAPAVELTEQDSESTVADLAAATLESKHTTINDDSEIISSVTDVEITEPSSKYTVADEAALTVTNKDEEATDSNLIETTVLEATQITSTSTTPDVVSSILVFKDADTNDSSETTTTVTTEATTESSLVDVLVDTGENNEGQIIADEESTATPTEPTQTTEYKEHTTIEDGKITTVDGTELTSESTIDDIAALTKGEVKTTNEETETTKIIETSEQTPVSTLADDVGLMLTTKGDKVTTNEDVETTVVDPTESTPASPTEVLDITKVIDAEPLPEATTASFTVTEVPCPQPCVCITEGDSNNYIVDCSAHDLTDLPTPIDPKTTVLNVQNNKLTVISKGISELKNLKVLNANDNLITKVEPGSVSELPELVSLKLANNGFQEYPNDLENTLILNKLQELDLSGNKFETISDTFLKYKALRTITLPTVSFEFVSELCSSLKETLQTVCTESCKEHSYECSKVLAQMHIKDDDVIIPGMIPFIQETVKEDTVNLDLEKMTIAAKTSKPETKATSDIVPGIKSNKITPVTKAPETKLSEGTEETSGSKDNVPVSDFSLRTAVNNAPHENVALHSVVIETSKESSHNESDIKVGAKTTETKGGGGVDKSVIAVIVAGMIIIVAVITIKKNWSSIRTRFSSTSRPNDHSGRHANGTTPEEVPLQDKSPV